MRFLFDSKLAPLTNNIGFIDSDIDSVLQEHNNWIEYLNKDSTDKITCEITKFQGSYLRVLRKLLPFAKADTTKTLIVQTKNNWCAIIDNGWAGSNLNPLRRISRELKVRYIRINAWEYNFSNQHNTNGWGGGDFIYNNQHLNHYRRVGIRHELIAWEFDQYGEPFDFEDLEIYKSNPIKKRLTPEMVDEYAKHFGIDFFNEDYYMPKGSKAYLIERRSSYYDSVELLSLKGNRTRLGLITDNELELKDEKKIFDFIKSSKEFWFTLLGIGLLVYILTAYHSFIDPASQSFSASSKGIKLFLMSLDKIGGKWAVIVIFLIAIMIYSFSTYQDYKKWKNDD